MKDFLQKKTVLWVTLENMDQTQKDNHHIEKESQQLLMDLKEK